MVTLVKTSYCLEDWDKINSSYTDYIADHVQQIRTLQEWIKKEPHLPHLSNSSLGLFLSYASGSTEGAKEIIDAYLTHKTRNPEFFKDRLSNMKKVEQTLDLVEVAAPNPWEINLKGGRLTFVRLVDTDVSKLDFHLAMQVFTAALDFELARVGIIITGVVAVLDMTGFHLGYLPKLNVMDVAIVLKYAQFIEKKVVCVHVINCNNLISQVMALIRPFLSKDLQSKLHFHTPNQMDEFYRLVPREYVPSTYGGTLESMPDFNEKFRKRFRGSEEWLKLIDSQEYLVNEKQRRIKAGCEEMNGSFRKLCID